MRAFWMLGLALLLAGTSVYLARNWIQGQVQPTIVQKVEAPPIEMATVVIAATPMFRGDRIRREHLRLVDWPADSVPPSAFTTIDAIIVDPDADPAAGTQQAAEPGGQGATNVAETRVVLSAIEINEPILKSKISGFGERASVSTMISPEMRAATIRMNDINGVAGFVLPGDHVDILLTRSVGDAKGGAAGSNLITDILLQNIRVLGIDQDANQQRDKPGVVKAVTVEVTPVQAQKLTLAQRLGDLSLALRHVANVAPETPTTVSLRDLKVGEANLEKGQKPVVVKKKVVVKTTPKKKAGLQVRIVRGTTASSVEVQKDRSPLFASPPEPQAEAAAPARQLADTTMSAPAASVAADLGDATAGTVESSAVESRPVAKRVTAPLSLLEPFSGNASSFEEAAQ
jgi:pilus assembly protein CpaB